MKLINFTKMYFGNALDFATPWSMLCYLW